MVDVETVLCYNGIFPCSCLRYRLTLWELQDRLDLAEKAVLGADLNLFKNEGFDF